MANQRKAVVIGVNDSSSGSLLPPLRYAERDAEAIAELLCDPETGTFDPGDVTLFTGPQARTGNIKAALRRIAIDSENSDVFVLYFAGHTLAPSWSHGTDLYLVTADLDESGLSEAPDAGLRKSFLIRDFLQFYRGTAVLLLDCCQASSLVTFRGADLISFDGREDRRHGVLAACAANEYAREDAGTRHGVFTRHVIEGLRGRAVDAHGVVTFESLSAYVSERDLDPQPTVLLQARGTTLLTRPAGGSTTMEAVPTATADPAVDAVPLGNPLDHHVPGLTRLIDGLARNARMLASGNAAVSRVKYVRSALGAEAVAYLGLAEPAVGESRGLTPIDRTEEFDLDRVRHLLPGADGSSDYSLGRREFGHVASDGVQRLWCAPLGRADRKVQLLAMVNPPDWFVDLGQVGAKVLEAIWHTDFAESPEESEVQVLTTLRSVFGRLPNDLFDRCLGLYRELLESLRIVFQPVVTIGESWNHVGVHSYEALARRSLTDQSAPFALLQLAHTWGDNFVIERDKVILTKALMAYRMAHTTGPWNGDVPKPISVNVSVRSVLDGSYVDTLRQLIHDLELHASAITLEISEQDAIQPWSGEQWGEAPHTYFNRRLGEIARDVGVAFALDDFGTGHASLSRMAELPLTHIKVDRAILHHRKAIEELRLVVAVSRDAIDRGEAQTARAVIVEGVDQESPVTLREIYKSGIKHVQGYITGERGSAELRRLSPEIRKDIASRVRGDDGSRPTGIARGDRAADGPALRRSA